MGRHNVKERPQILYKHSPLFFCNDVPKFLRSSLVKLCSSKCCRRLARVRRQRVGERSDKLTSRFNERARGAEEAKREGTEKM